MRKFVIVPVLTLAIAAAAAASHAANEKLREDAPREQWLSIAQLAEKLTAQGYDVRKVETERGVYEVEILDEEGRRIEAYVHPVTGEILKQELDD